MYTAKVDCLLHVFGTLPFLDGITLTLHEQRDVKPFIRFNNELLKYKPITKSYRLNIFKGVDISGIDLSIWKVKENIEWVKNCPLPKNEDFKKLGGAA